MILRRIPPDQLTKEEKIVCDNQTVAFFSSFSPSIIYVEGSTVHFNYVDKRWQIYEIGSLFPTHVISDCYTNRIVCYNVQETILIDEKGKTHRYPVLKENGTQFYNSVSLRGEEIIANVKNGSFDTIVQIDLKRDRISQLFTISKRPGEVISQFSMNPFNRDLFNVRFQCSWPYVAERNMLIVKTSTNEIEQDLPSHSFVLPIDANNILVDDKIYTFSNDRFMIEELNLPPNFHSIHRIGRLAFYTTWPHADDNEFIVVDLVRHIILDRIIIPEIDRIIVYNRQIYLKNYVAQIIKLDVIGFDPQVDGVLEILSNSEKVPDEIRIMFGIIKDHEALIGRKMKRRAR